MFNTNKTLEQKVKTSMQHYLIEFIERSIIIRPSEPHICVYIYIYTHSCTDAFTLSGFRTAFKAALNEWDSTGHRVAYIIMMGLMHPQRQKWFAFILRSTGAAVRALAPRERVWCASRSSRDCIYIYTHTYIHTYTQYTLCKQKGLFWVRLIIW